MTLTTMLFFILGSASAYISPKRVVKRFSELTPEEISDMWRLAQAVGSKIESFFKAGSLTMAIQVRAWLR